MNNFESHLQKSLSVREKFWQSVGNVDQDILTHIINPGLAGGIRWPSLNQRYLTIRTPDSTIIASDGLSDPMDDFDTDKENQHYNRVGLEFYVETIGNNLSDIKNSWQFQILYEISQSAAKTNWFSSALDEYKYVSTELYDVNVPSEWINPDERIGVLLGIPSKKIAPMVTLSIEPVKIVNVKLLTLKELAYVTEYGLEGRNELVQLFLQSENSTYSSLQRESVI